MLLIILKNLIFNVIILKVISYTLNCKVKFKYILLGSVIGSYRIFIKYIFDIAMLIVTFKSFRSIISYLTILGLYKGINSIPLVLLLYIINTRKKLYYNVIIKYNKKYIIVKGYLDTGNTLQYNNIPIVLINKKYISINKFFYVPYKTIDNIGLLKVIKPDYIILDGRIIKKVLLGIIENDVDMLLNPNIMEGI